MQEEVNFVVWIMQNCQIGKCCYKGGETNASLTIHCSMVVSNGYYSETNHYIYQWHKIVSI
jgi:hypothetical protein